MKIKWEVAPVPTGRFRSFETRGWPSATFENGCYAATLQCDDEYIPAKVRTGDHAEIKIRVALHGETPPSGGLETRVLKRRAATLQEAKAIVAEFYAKYPQHVSKEDKP